jgi:hypothetical protein
MYCGQRGGLRLPGEIVQLSMVNAQLRRVLGGQRYKTTLLVSPTCLGSELVAYSSGKPVGHPA